MNIYYEDDDETAELNLDAARREHRATRLIHDATTRKERNAEVQTAALIDIAASLRVLANEASAAMLPTAEAVYFTGEAEPFTPGDESDGPRDFLLEGDLVHLVGDTEPGEIVSLGFDGDGALYAEVEFGGGPVRLYASSLVRLTGDEGRDPEVLSTLAELREAAAKGVPLVGVATEGETPALLADSDEDGEEAVGGYELDDIDADFGDEPHPAAESAVDVLRANEAARKAAKKAATKKGSKK